MTGLLKFPYTRYPVKDCYGKEVDEVFRPMIPVTFVDGPKELSPLALIDTGADECCFPGELATYLGHNLIKGNPRHFNGVGGTVVAYLHQTNVVIAGHKLQMNIYYSDEWNASGICLLGQNSFLTRFNLILNRKEKEFELFFRG
ncbi:MAG: hypothetical protein WC926_05090 [Candidatus Paceibacterota bacterium]|jgi:predicted aspartyl protease